MPSIPEENALKWLVFLTVLTTMSYMIRCLKQFFKKLDVNFLKFSRRKDCEQIMSVKNDLKKVKMQDIGLSGNQSIFRNASLCPYYRMLWSKSKRLMS